MDYKIKIIYITNIAVKYVSYILTLLAANYLYKYTVYPKS